MAKNPFIEMSKQYAAGELEPIKEAPASGKNPFIEASAKYAQPKAVEASASAASNAADLYKSLATKEQAEQQKEKKGFNLGLGLKSVGKSTLATVPVLAETTYQAMKNDLAAPEAREQLADIVMPAQMRSGNAMDYSNDAEYARLLKAADDAEAERDALYSALGVRKILGGTFAKSALTGEQYQQLKAADQKVADAKTAFSRYNYEAQKAQSDAKLSEEAKRAEAEIEAAQKPVDPNRLGMRLMRSANEDWEKATEGLSDTGKFIANTGRSIAENVAALPLAVVNPALPTAVMGAKSAAQKSYELSEDGVEAGEALFRGVGSGLIEYATEKMPVDNLIRVFKNAPGGLSGAIADVIEQAGMEATEEMVSYIGNYILDVAAADPNAEFSIKELAESGLAGFISGGVMGTGTTAVGTVLDIRARTPENASVAASVPQQENTQEEAKEQPQNVATAVREQIAEEAENPLAVSADSAEEAETKKEKSQNTKTLLGKLRNAIPSLNELDAVATLSGKEFAKGSKKLTEQVGDFFRSLGGKVHRIGFGDVAINERSVRNDMSHGIGRAKAATFAAVPSVIENGRQIDFEENWKGRGYDSYVFAAPVKIGEKTDYVAAIVLKDRAENRFYLHEVLDGDGNIIFLDTEKDPEHIKNGVTAQGGITVGSGSSTLRVAEPAQDVKSGEARIDNVGAARSGFDPLSHAVNEYGAYPPGMQPRAREVDVPVSMDGKTKVPQTLRTIGESPLVTDEDVEMLGEKMANGDYNREVITDEAVIRRANRLIEDEGITKARNDLEKAYANGEYNKQNEALAIRLLQEYSKKKDAEAVASLVDIIVDNARNAGQQLQALRLLKALSPEGQLLTLRRTAQRVENEANQKQGNLNADDRRDIIYTVDSTREELLEELAAAFSQERENARNPQKPGNVPVENWMQEVGNMLENDIIAYVSDKQATPPLLSRTIEKDLFKLTQGELSKGRRAAAPPRTAVDTIRDYLANKEKYHEAWETAKQNLKRRGVGNGDLVGNGIDLSSSSNRAVDAALLDAMMENYGNELNGIIRGYLGDSKAVAQQLGDTIVRQTGAQGADAKALMQAAEKFVERSKNEKGQKAEKAIDKEVRRVMRMLDENIVSVIKKNSGDKADVANAIANTLTAYHGISPDAAVNAANIIVTRFNEQVASRAEKELSRYANRPQRKAKVTRKALEELANMGAFTTSNYKAEVERVLFGESVHITIDPNLSQEFLAAKTEGERDAAMEKIYKNIAEQTPSTITEKIRELRYTAMLANPSTHARNILGSAAMSGVATAKREVQALIERAAGRVGLQVERTTAHLTNNEADRALRSAAEAYFAKDKNIIRHSGRYTAADGIRDYKRAFNGRFTKYISSFAKFNSELMEKEDGLVLKPTYTDTFARWAKANGLTAENLANPTAEQSQMIERGREIALRESLQNTFRDASVVADVINNLANKGWLADVVVGGVVPFARSSVNITARSVEYSPLGLLKVAADVAQLRSGKKTSGDIINDLSKTLTGTGIMLVGYWLARLGLLVGGEDDNKKKAAFDRDSGAKTYAFKVGDHYYTIDFLAPAATALFIGAALASDFDNGDRFINNLWSAAGGVLDPLMQMTIFQGLNSAIQQAGYAGDGALTAILGNSAMNWVTQFVPSIVKKVGKIIDNTRRTTGTNETGIYAGLVKTGQRATNSLPGLSFLSPEYVDVWGETQKNGPDNVFARAAYSLASPGYYSKADNDAVTQEINRLYDGNYGSGVVPSKPDRTVTEGGVEHRMTNDEYTAYAKTKGQTSKKVLESLLPIDNYQKLTDSQKAKAIAYSYEYANEVAQAELNEATGKKLQIDSWTKNAMENGGSNPYALAAEYAAAKAAMFNVEGKKDSKGKTISGSVKAAKIQALVDAGWTRSRAETLYKTLG